MAKGGRAFILGVAILLGFIILAATGVIHPSTCGSWFCG